MEEITTKSTGENTGILHLVHGKQRIRKPMTEGRSLNPATRRAIADAFFHGKRDTYLLVKDYSKSGVGFKAIEFCLRERDEQKTAKIRQLSELLGAALKDAA